MAFNLSSTLTEAASGRTAGIDGRGDVVVPCSDGEWCAASVPPVADSPSLQELATLGATKSADELADELAHRGIPAARVADGRHLVESDVKVRSLPLYGPVDHPIIGEHLVELDPIVVDGARPPIRRAAPLLGEDTHDVLRTLGGYREAEIVDLVAAGVLQ